MRDAFGKINDYILFVYFMLMTVLSCVAGNPILLIIILLGGLGYYCYLDFTGAVKFAFSALLPLIAFVAVFNMLFVRKGATVLMSAFNVDFTLEALLFGAGQGMIFACCLLWLFLYGKVFGSQRLVPFLGKVSPYIALLVSMVLGFVTRFRRYSKGISMASKGLNRQQGSKFSQSLHNFSALTAMSLEGSIITGDSMRARGYSQKGMRFASSNIFGAVDFVILTAVVALTIAFTAVKATGGVAFIYEPNIIMSGKNPLGFLSLLILSFIPLTVDLTEDLLWQLSRRKI